MSALRILTSHYTEWKNVIPEEFVPSQNDMTLKYPWIDTFNENDIQTFSDQLKNALANLDSPNRFYSTLNKLIEKENIATSDKDEAFTDNLFVDWASTNAKINRITSIFQTFPHCQQLLRIGNVTCKIVGDYGIRFHSLEERKNVPICIVEESKRLLHEKSVNQLRAQRAAEMIGMATKNNSNLDRLQEIFCISVRHTYIGFWHAVFPNSYLAKIQQGKDIELNEVIEIKGFLGTFKNVQQVIDARTDHYAKPGLDLRVPEERILAFRLLWGIINYLGSGSAFMGSDYTIQQKNDIRGNLDPVKMKEV